MFLDVFPLQQNSAFPIFHKLITPPQPLANTGKMTLVIRFLLPVAVVAGLTSEISVAVFAVDPLIEPARRGLSAVWTLVTAQMIFNVLVGLVTNFTEIAGVVKGLYESDDVVVAPIEVEMKHLNC